nr:replication associated protein [Flumine microvirus 5]
MRLSCGQCIGCRLERSRQWAIRCVHEASLYKRNCFVTLTYADEFVPVGGSLEHRHFQLFMKRLRSKYAADRPRFYMCGEYGEENLRPHYHACLFNFDFPDKLYYRKGSDGSALYRSDSLDKLWGFGFCTVGAVTFESAAYCARYIMKKVNGDLAHSHYNHVDLVTGEVFNRVPEFTHMSLKPGIGAGWLGRFQSDVYPHGMVVSNAKEVRPPSYYDRKFKRADPVAWERIALERVKYAREREADSTPERLSVRRVITEARVAQFKRVI